MSVHFISQFHENFGLPGLTTKHKQTKQQRNIFTPEQDKTRHDSNKISNSAEQKSENLYQGSYIQSRLNQNRQSSLLKMKDSLYKEMVISSPQPLINQQNCLETTTAQSHRQRQNLFSPQLQRRLPQRLNVTSPSSSVEMKTSRLTLSEQTGTANIISQNSFYSQYNTHRGGQATRNNRYGLDNQTTNTNQSMVIKDDTNDNLIICEDGGNNNSLHDQQQRVVCRKPKLDQLNLFKHSGYRINSIKNNTIKSMNYEEDEILKNFADSQSIVHQGKATDFDMNSSHYGFDKQIKSMNAGLNITSAGMWLHPSARTSQQTRNLNSIFSVEELSQDSSMYELKQQSDLRSVKNSFIQNIQFKKMEMEKHYQKCLDNGTTFRGNNPKRYMQSPLATGRSRASTVFKEFHLDYNMEVLKKKEDQKRLERQEHNFSRGIGSPPKGAQNKHLKKEEFQQLIGFLDEELSKQPNHDASPEDEADEIGKNKFNQLADTYWVDQEKSDQELKYKFDKFRETFQENSMLNYKVRKENYKYFKFMEKNSIVIQMIDQNARDIQFQEQMAKAKPETKEFINAIIQTFEILDLKQRHMIPEDAARANLKSQSQRRSVGKSKPRSIKVNEAKAEMQRQLKQKFMGLVKQKAIINQNIEAWTRKKKKNTSIDLYSLYNQIKQQTKDNPLFQDAQYKVHFRGDFIEGRNDMDFTNRAVKRFRRFVELNCFKRHHLKYFETVDVKETNCNLIVHLYSLKRTLDKVLPTKKFDNIGLKYKDINKNIYTNDFYHGIKKREKSLFVKEMMRKYFNIQNEQITNDTEESKESLFCFDDEKAEKIDSSQTDLNNLFTKQIGKEIFYKQIKSYHLGLKEYADLEKNAIMDYRFIQRKKMLVPQPNFVTFSEHIMFLSQKRIQLSEAEALHHYLKKTGALIEKRVYRLIIEQCSMSDESLNKILQGIIGQCIMDQTNENIQMQYLQSFLYSNNDLGLKSLSNLKALIPFMFEFGFNNVRLNGGNLDGQLYNCSDVLEEILMACAKPGNKLMKLKLTKMNLRRDGIITQIIEMMSYNKNMISLDLAFGQLLPKQLNALSQGIASEGWNLRSLNLSYNILNRESSAYKHISPNSEAFMNNIEEFVANAQFLNHINFSGMNFRKEQIMQLIKILRNCQFLLALHLSDNGITLEKEFYYDCLEEFRITEEDVIEINRSKVDESNLNPKPSKKYDKQDINYKRYLQEYFAFEQKLGENPCCHSHHQDQGSIRKQYKDRIILSKQRKIVDEFKAINAAQVYYGLGRQIENGMDRFVVSRQIGMGGLIFNQQIKNDKFFSNRFFNIRESTGWSLSKGRQCFVCDKHQLTVIFYDRSLMAQNSDLVQIKNKEFVNKLKKDFLSNYSKFYSMSPVICGTIVNKGIGQPVFDRKLKMLQARVYCLLQLMQSKEFIKDAEHKQAIYDAIEVFMKTESYYLLETLGIDIQMQGWEKLLHDMCLQNELMNVKNINIPNFQQLQTNSDYYLFADFLKPGYHQLLIYDPQSEKAYCKDFVVNMNIRENLFPEYPMKEPEPKGRKHRAKNVWRHWYEDSQEDIFKSFEKDLENQNAFSLSKYIKDPIDAANLQNIMLENFDIIKIYQKHLMFRSKKYPQIELERIWYHMMIINETSSFKAFNSEQWNVTRAQVEQAFMAVSKSSDITEGSLLRCELYEFILRLCKAWVEQVYSKTEKISTHLQAFIDLYLVPFYDKSIIIRQRKQIKHDLWINQLLYDNIEGLQIIFNSVSEADTGLFTIECAHVLFEELSSQDLDVDQNKIEQCFQFSQMTVLDETKNITKYQSIEFVEFCEMLCRIAIISIKILNSIDYKLELLLKLIFDKYYNNEVLDKNETQFYSNEKSLR